MASFPSLPNLPGLPALNVSLPGIGGGFGTTLSAAVSGAASDATKATFGKSFLGGVSFTNIVSVVVGLIFILAAVLSFKSTRDVVVQGVKTAASATV